MVTPSGAPRPSGAFYWIGVLVILAGVGIFVITVVGGLRSFTDSMTRLVAPGQVTFPCRPGSYTIYHEYESTIDGVQHRSETIGGLSVAMKDGAGNPVALATPFGSSRYTIGGRSGRSAFAGRVKAEGTCTLTAEYPSEWIPGPGSEVVLAVGRGFGDTLAKMIAVGGISLFAGLTIGTLVIVMTARRRRRIRL